MTTHATPSVGSRRSADREPIRPKGGARHHWRGFLAGLAFALLVAVALMWQGGQTAERNALLRMTPEDRRVLFEESRRHAEAVCGRADADTGLVERCADAATFLLAFPECDQACESFVRARRHGPTR
jgi:hypothetical protein